MKKVISLGFVLLMALSLLAACGETAPVDTASDTPSVSSAKEPAQSKPNNTNDSSKPSQNSSKPSASITLQNIPEYAGRPYITLNSNVPDFSESEKKAQSFERYSALDSLGRCGIAFACVGRDIMPTEDRGEIGQVKPSGWHTVKYDCVDGKYLYNRCHLIGYQLTGENANRQNLITGTRYMNVDGMLPFENMIADYVKETNNHVLYRVTPVFKGNELVCRGVVMEALSIEDNGDGITFNVFVYNAQPGIEINYATGESRESAGDAVSSAPANGNITVTYILNTNTKKYHMVGCGSANKIKAENKKTYTGPLSGLDGYSPCGICKPQEALK